MNQPPVTKYKDEVDQTQTQSVLDKELDKAAEAAKVAAQEPAKTELKVLPVEKHVKKGSNASSIVNAFRQKMATNSTPIELPSRGKTVEFKEISTAEQKDMSKVAMENDSRADIVYCAMLGLINRLALEKGFEIREYTEFERMAIVLNLQQMNKINPEIKFTCEKCGKENAYHLDTSKLLREFSKTYHADLKFETETSTKKFTFTLGWPTVRNVEDFFKTYYRKYDSSSKNARETINNLSQIEYLTMFVKNVEMVEKSDETDRLVADLESLTYNERVQIIDCLPQSLLFDDDTGVVSKVVETFVNPMNNVFKYHDCTFCGAEQTGAMANLTDFLGY